MPRLCFLGRPKGQWAPRTIPLPSFIWTLLGVVTYTPIMLHLTFGGTRVKAKSTHQASTLVIFP